MNYFLISIEINRHEKLKSNILYTDKYILDCFSKQTSPEIGMNIL